MNNPPPPPPRDNNNKKTSLSNHFPLVIILPLFLHHSDHPLSSPSLPYAFCHYWAFYFTSQQLAFYLSCHYPSLTISLITLNSILHNHQFLQPPKSLWSCTTHLSHIIDTINYCLIQILQPCPLVLGSCWRGKEWVYILETLNILNDCFFGPFKSENNDFDGFWWGLRAATSLWNFLYITFSNRIILIEER